MKENKKLHWYLFMFMYPGGRTYQDGYFGYADQTLITLKKIKEAKTSQGIPPDALLMNVSYLGYGTKEEFLGE